MKKSKIKYKLIIKKLPCRFSFYLVYVKNPVTNENFKIDFVIVDEEFTSLLSGNAAQAMELITVNYVNF